VTVPPSIPSSQTEKDLEMLEELNGETALYPIIGDPIIYVKSPQRLTARFEALGHNGV
jgi:shikimate dehydrogenase